MDAKDPLAMFVLRAPDDDDVCALYDEAQSADGYVSNYLRAWAWRPRVFRMFREARKQLSEETTLSSREVAILNSTAASRLGDAYCSIAWGTNLADLSDAATAGALLRRDETPGLSPRERALIAWASSVVAHPNRTTSADVDRLRAAGFSDREIFDATLFVSFRLAFCTVNDALGVRPDAQLARAAPAEVLAGVTYGRAADGEAAP